jgi:hypothetical protein
MAVRPAPIAEPVPIDDTHPTRRRIGWITGIAGGGAIAIGIGVGVTAEKRWSEAVTACNPERVCTQEGHDAARSARRLANVSTALFGVGVAALATGIVLVAISPNASEPRIVPTVGDRSVGLSLQGGF